ncbi:MAG: M48 family metallopeptidase [Cyanobacteria bacterium SIG28]|nr:M48 family metallopeptidase [Cyanobacteria bacterium SIG28]
MNFNKCVTNKETVYFGIMLAISIIVYLILAISIIGILYALIFGLMFWYVQAFSIGQLKHNSVKITQYQFPDIYSKVKDFSQKLGLEAIPTVYMVQSGGLLNAFATRFSFRNFVVLYSDVMELAYEQGESAVDFIIAHELAHLKRGHLTRNLWIIWGKLIPFLGTAYSRACEYTCDNIASALVPEKNLDGLMVILAGKKLYKNVNVQELLNSAKKDAGYWVWVAEIYSTHPNLVNRISNLYYKR